MNPITAFTQLATSLPLQVRKWAYQVALVLLLVVSGCVFFSVPELPHVAWVDVLAILGVASGVLHGVANANATAYTPKHKTQD